MAEPIIPDNSTTTPDNVPITPDNVPENVPTIPDAPLAEEAPQERPKTRGRPWGSKDAKPRIRRVPVVVAQEEEEPVAAPAATQKVQIAEPAEEPAQHPPEPPRKSPRTLHQEHVQALAAERRALAQAKQAHYESMFDRNLSW